MIRFAPVPFYNNFEEVYCMGKILAAILDKEVMLESEAQIAVGSN